MIDILIKNATIIDGTGTLPFHADVGILNGKIACIGNTSLNAKKIIDATGLTLTPGWIDSHSHYDSALLTLPDQEQNVEQGITFSITGQCGSSPILKTSSADQIKQVLVDASRIPQGSGAAILVGHSTVRRMVMGTENRAPSESELETMKTLVREAMDAGAIGMSLGLVYVPGCYAAADELIALAKIVRECGGVLAAHIRNEGDTLVESVAEFLHVVKESGCRGIISHHKAMDPKNWGKISDTLALIDQANADGAEVFFDVYPYCASATSLISRFLPKRFHPEGTVDRLALLNDPQICSAIKAWGIECWGPDLSWTLVSSCPGCEEYEGLTISEIAARRGQTDQYETAFDLIRESKGRAHGCFFLASEDDLQMALRHPNCMIGTDSYVARKGASYHPRLRGAFPRAIARYVRDFGVLSLPEMIRRMTSLPAFVYGLEGKGKIAVGADADICIFDADTIQDHADYTNCGLPNEGLHYVIIDGKIVLEHGVYNGTRAGKLLLKTNG